MSSRRLETNEHFCVMYWILLKLMFMTFVPLPVNPKVTRPDPKRLFWTFTCDEFKSAFQLAKVFYTDTKAAEILRKTD